MFKKAQAFLGYVVLILILVIAFYAMAVFLKGVFGGKYKNTADAISGGEQFDIKNLDKYTDDQIKAIDRENLSNERIKSIFPPSTQDK